MQVGQEVGGSIAAGEDQLFEITLPQGKFTVETGGTANILWGIWKDKAEYPNGRLKICGVGAWGVHDFKEPGNYVIRVRGNTTGVFTFKIRKYRWPLDELWLRQHKSTC